MKRIFALLLSVSLFLSCMISTAVYGAENYSYKYGDVKLAKDVAETLDIVSYTEETANDTVSRIDFAIYLARLLKIDEYVKLDKYYFTDVDNTHYGCAAVNTLCELGIISQNDARLFYPDNAITKPEISKMLLNALGYKEYAEVKGGYPNGYMNIASKSDIFKGVGEKDTFTVSEISLILINAASVAMYSPKIYSTDVIEYAVNSEQTIFSLYHNIFVELGTVYSVGNVSLTENIAGDGRAIIGSNLYLTEENYADYIGEKVYVYYYSQNGNQRNILYIRPSERQEIENITSDEYSDFKDNVFSYYEVGSDRKTTKNTDNTTVFLKNGKVLLYNIEKEMDIEFGFYKLIDSDRDKVYETVIVEEVETIVVGAVDRLSGVIYDKITENHSVDVEKYTDGTVLVFDSSGNEISVNNIVEGDVLSVVRNEMDYLKISVCRKSENVVLKSVSVKDHIIIKTEENTYNVSDSFADYGLQVYRTESGDLAQRFKLGERYVLRFDVYGRVAYVDNIKGGSEYVIGYVITVKNAENGFDNVVGLKLLCEDRNINMFDCTENVKIDGVKMKTPLEAYTVLMGANKVIRFKINDDNEIYDVDTSVFNENNESEYSLRCTREYDRTALPLKYMSSTDLFGLTHLTDDNTVVFNVPANDTGAKDRDYAFGAISQFMDQTGYNIEIYKIGDEPGADDIIVCRQDNSIIDETVRRSTAVIVAEVSETINSEGALVKSISGYQSGTYLTFLVEADFDETTSLKNYASDAILTLDDIDEGDIIKIGKNSYDEIDKIQYYVDGDNLDSTKWAPCNGEFNDRGRQEIAYCLRKKGTVIEWSYAKGGELAGVIDLKTTKVVIYDANNARTPFRVGTANDIISYESAGQDCSRLYIGAYVTRINTVIIYK